MCQTRTRFWFKVRKNWDETPAQPSASCAGKVTHATWASSPHLSHGEMTAANTHRGPGGLPRASWMLIHGILTTSCKVGVAVIIPISLMGVRRPLATESLLRDTELESGHLDLPGPESLSHAASRTCPACPSGCKYPVPGAQQGLNKCRMALPLLVI